jgi:hypothetical protein
MSKKLLWLPIEISGYVHDNIVKDVDWYGERVLGEVSLGGIIILVVIRTIQHNMLKVNVKGYSSNKIRKTQNEHLNIVCQNLNMPISWLFILFLYHLFFALETIGVS